MNKTAAAALLSVAVILSGCNQNGGSGKGPVAYIENPPEDSAKGFFDITYDAWYSEYRYRTEAVGYTEEKDAELCKSYRSDIVEYLKQEKIVLYLAEKLGITRESLTEEEMKDIDKATEESLKSWYDNYESDAKLKLGSDYTDEELLQKEKELFEEYLKSVNLTIDDLTSWKINEAIREKYIAAVGDTISDDEVKDFVQDTIDTAKETYEKDIEAFEKTYTPFYIPEGTRVVQQLVVLIDDISASEVTAYRKDGDNEKADEILNKALEKVKFRIDEAYQKLEQGVEWKTVQEEYNDETDTNDKDFSLYPKSSTVKSEVIDAAMKIEKKGTYSGIIQNDSGYCIIYYKDDLEFTDEKMESLLSQGREFLADQKSYQNVTDFLKEHPYVMDYELLNIDDPSETTAEETA